MTLHDRILRLIAATGPISVADYMAMANAHYYATRDPLGVDGDFTTAPEISQMFGELAGLALADAWDRAGRDEVIFVELGPGRGTLARDAVGAMARAGLAPPVHLVETSPTLRAAQAALIPSAQHHDRIATLPADRPLLILANEFFDALPVRQFVRTETGWRELLIGIDGDGLVRGAGATPQDEAIPPVVAGSPVGSVWESCPAASAIMTELADRLVRQGGAMILVDYGYWGPAAGDTLQAVRSHGFADVLRDAGEADLTAHVDFAALAATATLSGATVSALVAQGDWLTHLGIAARSAALAARHPERADDVRGQHDRLVNADAMGHLFKVLAIHHPRWPQPAGFVP